MKQFVYIQAYYHGEQDAREGLLSFRHAKVEAKDEDDAYTKGYRQIPTSTYLPLNDYVVEV